jgi:hypothetical protein
VHPILDGLSPVLMTAAVLILFGETLTPTEPGSIVLIVTGLLTLALARLGGEPLDRRGALVASVSVMTATYTVLDGVGVRLAGSVIGYLAWLMALARVDPPLYGSVCGSRRD